MDIFGEWIVVFHSNCFSEKVTPKMTYADEWEMKAECIRDEKKVCLLNSPHGDRGRKHGQKKKKKNQEKKYAKAKWNQVKKFYLKIKGDPK